jgi:hypothetical protein
MRRFRTPGRQHPRAKVPGAGRATPGRQNRQTWMRRATASTISATAWSTGTPFFCSPLR